MWNYGLRCALAAVLAVGFGIEGWAQTPLVEVDQSDGAHAFLLADGKQAAAIYVCPRSPDTVRVAAEAFAGDVERVTGVRPRFLTSLQGVHADRVVIVGVVGQSPEIDALAKRGTVPVAEIEGKWESAVTAIVAHPAEGIERALVVAGSDRRGAAFALFRISREMGVSPWTWWADVPVQRHSAVYVRDEVRVQHEPSVQYRGIFLNDEDWGLRPWAAKKMDPELGNVGPHTYERIFELLLRLQANSLWPAMHPGTLAFNAVPENARLADRWGIVMGSSHSEALLRNNVGEWDEKRDGKWNYQINKPAIDAYWEKRVQENGQYENFYTVGMRGVHDTGLEATGSATVKARLVEQVMQSQRGLLGKYVAADMKKVPQVIWLYKESLSLYRAGMIVPDDVTLGWTDDNYGYIRQLPTVAEQRRAGGSGMYYHVSYWGSPHDYLWLCTTPPALIREEMTKAYDHGVRRYWILNVGDLKPAEIDIDYFMQLGWDEPATAAMDEKTFLTRWAAEQFPIAAAPGVADVLARYYQLNFVRKPEFMGFNGYNDGINRTAFNPNAWGVAKIEGSDHRGQNGTRLAEWSRLREDEKAVANTLPPAYSDSFFELVGYPVEAAAAMNEKFLYTDRTFLDASLHDPVAMQAADAKAHAAYATIQGLTARFNTMEGGKWLGMMSDEPRKRHVFEMPRTATEADVAMPLPPAWFGGGPQLFEHAPEGMQPLPPPGFRESMATVSINASHFERKQDGPGAQWTVLSDLGISGGSVEFGAPGKLANAPSREDKQAPWLEYDFRTVSTDDATLTLHLLPTFPVDAHHRLRFGVSLDGGKVMEQDAMGTGEWQEGNAPAWSANVLRNSSTMELKLGKLTPGKHTLRLIYRDPGVVFEHLVITFSGAPPAYPVPPETVAPHRFSGQYSSRSTKLFSRSPVYAGTGSEKDGPWCRCAEETADESECFSQVSPWPGQPVLRCIGAQSPSGRCLFPV